MNITFRLNGKKQIKNIDIRLYLNKFDICTSTNLVVFENDWENEQSKSDTQLNENLLNLKLNVLKQYNLCFAKGIVINANWLKNVVKTTFDRPNKEVGLINQDYTIYFSDFASYWIDYHSKDWKTSARKNMSKVLVSQYASFVGIFKDYEKTINSKLELRLLTQEQIYLFIEYLQGLDYSVSTIKRMLGRVSFMCNRAKDLKLDICSDHSLNFFLEEENEFDGIYLSEKEIKSIYDLDLSDNNLLDNVRDNLIISCWSGLRISDFMTNLKTDNIKDGIISIKTQKTGSFVKLPLHFQVKNILAKRFGQLPSKMIHSEYNKHLKIVCKLAKIDNVVFGKLFDNNKKRKVSGNYPKYMLCSSHIGRKSLVSNLRGKVSDDLIASIGGWKTKDLLNTYDNTTKLDYANELEIYFNNN
jgi:integrase